MKSMTKYASAHVQERLSSFSSSSAWSWFQEQCQYEASKQVSRRVFKARNMQAFTRDGFQTSTLRHF